MHIMDILTSLCGIIAYQHYALMVRKVVLVQLTSETCIPLYGNLLESGKFKLGEFADTAEIFRI